MYRTLNADKIINTLEALEQRIEARFLHSGLTRVCNELTTIARESSARVEQIGRRNLPLRAGVAAILAGCIWLLIRIVPLLSFEKVTADNVYSVLQGVDASMNILVLMGAAVVFLVTVEERVKRKRALDALHELRSIIHVIDMHQLTKDPSMVGMSGEATAVSPARTFTPFELTRYLDYCSEMLSLSAKVAALYAQSFPDPVVTEAVSDLERITANLSQKIWQKISLVQSQTLHGAAPAVSSR